MKRSIKLIIGATTAIALTGTVIAVFAWLFATTNGAHRLLAMITPVSGIDFSVKKIEGRIIDHLLLKEVRIGLAQRKLEIDSLELRWKPLLLLMGSVGVRELTLNGVRIQDNTPLDNKPPIPVWPRVSRTAQLFDGKIVRLRVTDLSYRRLQEQPVRVVSFVGSVTWQDDVLSFGDFKVVSPSGGINGNVSAGFRQPSLTAALIIAPTRPIAEMDRFSVDAHSVSGKGAEQIVGMIAVTGSAGSRKLFELSGDVGMARTALNLRRISLTAPGRRGLLRADGSLAFTNGESLLTLQVNATELDLAPELKIPTDLSGVLKFAGTLDSYRGDFTLANRAKGWQSATVSATYQGTRKGMKLFPLTASIHDEALAGTLDIDWRDGFAIQGELKGKGFDLRASGELNQRLNVAANISDFSRLVPGSTGTLRAEGWIRSRAGRFSGAVVGTGSRLAYGETRISSANLTARLDQGTGYPLHFAASLRDAVYDGYTFNAVTLAADGTLPRHTVSATLVSGGSEARMTLSAGYNDGVWKGEITRLAGSDGSGPWNLTAPATFAVSSGKIFLSPLALRAGASERLELAADLNLKPMSGQVRAQWAGVNLARFKPWLPQDTKLDGRISGLAKGIILPGQRFELDGNAVLSGGNLHRQMPEGELNFTFNSATATWGWRGEALTGDLSLTMAEYGKVRANFQLPIPAAFPVAVNHKGPLKGSITGKVLEKGMLTAMFPGLIRESSGELELDLAVTGTWDTPLIGGKLQLAKAGAYLPTAGIHLKEVRLSASLENNLIRIDSFRALSGPGYIEGTALITMTGRRVTGYKGVISGENFQTVYLPELQLLSTPNLSFEGTPEKLTLRGELRIPDLHIVGSEFHKVIAPSSDVVLEGRVVPAAKRSPLVLDVRIRLLLGEKVFIKVSGIDARLGGAMDLTMNSFDRAVGTGEIKVIKGRFRTYGVNLEIVRGRLFFASGPINNPSLDFLALRTIGEVRAGVTVAGTLRKPVTKLYSEPAMPDVDVLAYIVLGHPLAGSGEQADLMTRAAGALLTSGKAEVLQEKIRNYLGLSTLEIQGGVGKTPGSMGYKPLQVTPPGAIPAEQQSGFTETVLTVGKYLTPELYISYGKSLFTGGNLIRLRYDFFKHWQIETQTGSESGADLYYKLEFK